MFSPEPDNQAAILPLIRAAVSFPFRFLFGRFSICLSLLSPLSLGKSVERLGTSIPGWVDRRGVFSDTTTHHSSSSTAMRDLDASVSVQELVSSVHETVTCSSRAVHEVVASVSAIGTCSPHAVQEVIASVPETVTCSLCVVQEVVSSVSDSGSRL